MNELSDKLLFGGVCKSISNCKSLIRARVVDGKGKEKGDLVIREVVKEEKKRFLVPFVQIKEIKERKGPFKST